jgi:hypothetical protein
MADDLQNLQGVLLGLGLNALPSLLMNLHKAQSAGRNLSEGRSHKDDGPSSTDQQASQGGGDAYALQSVLAPLLAQLQGAGGGGGGQQPMPAVTPGMRPGMPPAPLPRMPGLPRTMQAGASPSGF